MSHSRAQVTVWVKRHAGSGVVCVNLAGEADLSNAGSVRDHLMGLVNSTEKQLDRIDLDLSQLGFCDCATLTVLIQIHQAAAAKGCPVTISAAAPIPALLLRLSGVDQVFDFDAPDSAAITGTRV